MQKQSHSLFFSLVLAFALLCLPLPAMAAQEEFAISRSEDFGIAFYKKAGFEPDFKEWVMGSEAYEEVSAFNKKAFLDEEQARLKQKYDAFDPEEDFLTVAIKARIRFTTLMHSHTGEKMMEIELEEPRTHFSVLVGGNMFAIIVRDLSRLFEHKIEQNDVSRIQKHLGEIEDGKDIAVEMKLKLKVISVDATAPMKLQETYQWLMMTDVASLSLWRKDNYIWEWQAPWYETETERRIRLLFRE